MFKKTMTFDDLDGNEVSQTFYFNYNKKEIAELLEFGRILRFPAREGAVYLPLEEQMAKLSTPVEESGLTQRENNEQAYEIFQNLLLDAYGEKGADNVSFNKTAELRHYWSTHVAFVEMVFEFLENTQLAAEFIEKCLPGKMVEQAKKEIAAERNLKVTPETLTEMVLEADRRQQDPATRIEPGIQGAIDGGVIDPSFLVREDLVASPEPVAVEVKGQDQKDLTPEQILKMDEDDFKKLDPRTLGPEQLLAAFRRKNQ